MPADILLCEKNNFKDLEFLKSGLSNPPLWKVLKLFSFPMDIFLYSLEYNFCFSVIACLW